MEIHVVPPHGYEEDEVYKVSMKQHAKLKQGVFFSQFYSTDDLCQFCAMRR